jgi:membrane protein YdbS with pleckstrin-like domain
MRERDDEQVILEARRHGIVLVGPLLRSLLLAVAGGALLLLPSPGALGAPFLIAGAALLALRCVWRWEATRLVVTRERLLLSTGILRRRQTGIRFARLGPVEVEQTILGRLLGYGTLVAGDLQVSCVARPREVGRLVERLAA